MATISRSRSQKVSSVPKPELRRSSSTSLARNLQPPEPAISRDGNNNSAATVFPYSSPGSSSATLVEKQDFTEIDLGLPKEKLQVPQQSHLQHVQQAPPQEPEPVSPKQSPNDGPAPPDLGVKILEGWALGLTVATLCFGLFLSTLESTIISTSLVTIASELGDYQKASWVVVTYLLTYTSFLVIWTRLSDILGRKVLLITATVFFIGASVACALAQTMTQLIGFRSLQGIGGSGLYALCYASILDVVPFRLMGPVSGAMSMASACSSVLGPVIGGAITSHTTWRWVFWINVPTGAFIIAFVIIIFPNSTQKFSPSNLRQIDVLGVFLSLGASIFLIVPLEEGGTTYAWSSLTIIFLIVASGICWGAFGVWEWWLTGRGNKTRLLPIFPMRLLSHRVIAATMATGFFAGFPFMVVVVNLPQRMQIVNGMTPAAAGIHILPLLSQVAVGAFVTGIITSKVNIAWYLLVGSTMMTTLGVGLMSNLPTSPHIPPVEYFYQIILGFGFGMTLTCLMVVVRSEVQFQDNAVATGAITQVRTLGGVIGLAVVQAVMTSHVIHDLVKVVPPEKVQSILISTENIALLDPVARAAARAVFGSAINLQFRTITGFAAASFGCSLFVWRKNKIDMHALEAQRIAAKSGKPAPTTANNTGINNTDHGNMNQDVDVEAQQCCSVDTRSLYSTNKDWEGQGSQTWQGEGGSARVAHKSRWDGGDQSDVWGLSTHPIPQSWLFNPPEVTCPRCGYSIQDKLE